MMKNRLLAILLALLMVVSLASCSGNDNDNDNDNDSIGDTVSDDVNGEDNSGVAVPDESPTGEPDGEVRYIAFTSDSHFDIKNGSLLDDWMAVLQQDVGKLDYMAYLGDHGSAYLSVPAFWESVEAYMEMADKHVESGFVENESIFLFGNHEWYTFAGGDYRNNMDQPAAQRLTPAGETVETDWYILYAFGVTDYTEGPQDFGSAQHFTEEAIEALDGYLETAPSDIPIFVMAHYPIHTYKTSREDRVSGNAGLLLDTLNKHPNVIFLWGHNHSSVDPSYDTVFSAGDTLLIGPSDIGETREINFTYAAAGCMSDTEYRPDIPQVTGKGLLATIDGADVTLKWYGKPETATP